MRYSSPRQLPYQNATKKTNAEIEKALVFNVMKDMDIDVADLKYMEEILSGLICATKHIFSTRIPFGQGKIDASLDTAWSFSEAEITDMISQMSYRVKSLEVVGLLHENTLTILIEEKLPILKQQLHGSFKQSFVQSFNAGVKEYNKREKKASSLSIDDLLTQYFIDSPHFCDALKTICRLVLSPSTSLLNLSIILNSKGFHDKSNNDDFERITTTKLFALSAHASGLSEEIAEVIAQYIFENHPYIFCISDSDLDVSHFKSLANPLCKDISEMLGSKKNIGLLEALQDKLKIVEICAEYKATFTTLETVIIRAHLRRLSCGLLSWSINHGSESCEASEGGYRTDNMVSELSTRLKKDLDIKSASTPCILNIEETPKPHVRRTSRTNHKPQFTIAIPTSNQKSSPISISPTSHQKSSPRVGHSRRRESEDSSSISISPIDVKPTTRAT